MFCCLEKNLNIQSLLSIKPASQHVQLSHGRLAIIIPSGGHLDSPKWIEHNCAKPADCARVSKSKNIKIVVDLGVSRQLIPAQPASHQYASLRSILIHTAVKWRRFDQNTLASLWNIGWRPGGWGGIYDLKNNNRQSCSFSFVAKWLDKIGERFFTKNPLVLGRMDSPFSSTLRGVNKTSIWFILNEVDLIVRSSEKKLLTSDRTAPFGPKWPLEIGDRLRLSSIHQTVET